MPMNPEIKKRWVEALRGDKYAQGKGKLRNADNTYCCLGVLCDLYSKENAVPWETDYDERYFFILDNDNILPDTVAGWAGLPNRNPSVTLRDADEDYETDLADANDGHGYTFEKIANIIEEQL